ncbi:enoyl-acyl carrier protein reductase FabMG [Pseudovibrio denitrificans]|uniref:enoyl ACP reductase FabMG family protein n=1 Tax=Pseudovibrio denitrificans TaxID=258256 RepID=UPI0039BF6CFD
MNTSRPLEKISHNTLFREGDIFVLFGELFGRGYATGLLEQAKAAGMDVIGITVGRRDADNTLRALTDEELAEAEANLGGKIINVPLMAGFDQDAPEGTPTPTELVNEMTMDTWQEHKLDWDHLAKCRELGTERFKASLAKIMEQLNGMIPAGKNVFFAHTMAGGIPRAKVFMAIANRIYKGRGARHMPSQNLIDSDLGKLILQNFDEVTANSFGHLLEASKSIRERIEADGGQVRYTAYGYHGTRVLIDGEYKWQTYTSYTQGFAKMNLENFAKAAWDNGVKATVFNCPEIRTNSSDVFAGIELSLLPLLAAFKKEGGGAWVDGIWQKCQDLLKDDATVEDMLQKVSDYQQDDAMQPFYNFEAWPMQNSAAQVDKTVGTSQEIVDLHKNRKELISDELSQHVVAATGALIFGEASEPAAPVLWLDHDMVAQSLIQAN